MDYTPWEMFENISKKYQNKTMIVYNGKEFSYGMIEAKACEYGELLQKWNFRIGGIYLPNGVEFITYMMALNRIKKVVVPLSYQFRGEVLRELINYSDIEILITDKNGYNEICSLNGELHIKIMIVLQDSDNFVLYHFASESKHKYALKEDAFCICFTSGSTSKPKGIVLSNFAVTGNAQAVADYLNFGSEEKTIIPRSFAQASPITGDILMTISRGGTIIILNDLFHPAIFLKAVQDYGATNVFMIRTMFSQILEYPQIGNFDISSMKRVMLGGMVNPAGIFRRAAGILPGIRLYNAYGLSEASARVSFLGPEDVLRFPGSIGKPMRGCDIKVYKEDGNEAGKGEIGEIYVISSYVMDGYYKSEEITAAALTPKGLRTRDTGYKDENGMTYVVGRNDDLIIQGGNKVYPAEIEEILLMHPSIEEAVVLGIEDEKLGQKIVALVRCIGGSDISCHGIYQWCSKNLENKKLPKDIKIVERIPKNTIGKINRNELKTFYNNLNTCTI
jgi:acyl-CoA synthetase (AMP-forming)/AMP-acid ligase II